MSLEITCTRNEADHKQISRCKRTIENSSDSFKAMSKILALAGSEVRLKILFLLNIENELCPCDIADILEMSVPAVSQHIRKMKDAGIITSRREGQTLYYSLVKSEDNVLNGIFSSISIRKKTA
ncbi:ArsR/SmtB family transcription factor [Allomuricauda sp. XS_ASV26]|jgi:DNA-binding transcriptional ArsR family regulator|uniref:ArsR/SmtB family transcription factor n=2 Tax=Flagellimonas TaxID=444459 RepID=A0ABW4XX11_9FLAO|nr:MULTISPECIES: metalloregulator ArsR/SmtB family transcription factor [Allomuricauda]MEC7769880.1 metalloregulator ArsR/SmtB family transcription factor [Bacteroidota bacterium]MAO16718.1 transcriptional regulator [Allomuricauda sp.]MAU14590.1 transcriptional regulator [Allomuricauda sp.]MBA4745193.1 winged helix-turn-helix transcriptional regulator [Allomuricauda sp.]MBC71965.1 transcriptional regulator [Allomuricauda sp.]|tara:strand:- start:1373 stop:1744 length:372 start_codon:yes stop_codon:yes gene_type:complete